MPDNNWQKIKLIFLCLLALIGLGCGAFFAIIAVDVHWANKKALNAEPARMSVDLSQPGEYASACEQNFSHTHGQIIGFKFDPPFTTEQHPEEALEGLTGRIKVIDQNGKSVLNRDFEGIDILMRYDNHGDQLPAVYLGFPFARGSYQLVLIVEEPAERLQDVNQQAVMTYMFCGLEKLLEVICFAFSGVFFLFGIPSSIASYKLIKKYRIRTTVNN